MMNYLSYIVSFFLGLAITFVVTRSDEKIETRAEVRRDTKVRDRGDAVVGARKFGQHLLVSGDVPMESRHRNELRDSLLREWANADPAGFLADWKNRAWPEDSWNGAGEVALKRYAEIYPAGLLEYARAEGCDAAWFSYLEVVSPHVAIQLLGERDASEFPVGWLNQLMAKGMEIDPDFHLLLERITDPAMRKDALSSVASSMLSTRRLTDLASFVTLLDSEPGLLDDLACKAGEQMIAGDLSVAELSILPEHLREKIVPGFLNYEAPQNHSKEINPAEAADFIAKLMATGWVNQHGKDIVRFIDYFGTPSELSSYGAEDENKVERRELSMKWLTVAVEAPDELKEIRLPMVINALNFYEPTPDVIAKQISDPYLRDRAMAFLATSNPEALEHIRSVEIRSHTRDYIEWKSRNPPSEDPFAELPEYPGKPPWDTE